MADAAVGKGHSYGEINSMQKNAFDLGVFVGDLSFEEDASSDDVSLEGLQEELEECKNDDVSGIFFVDSFAKVLQVAETSILTSGSVGVG
ncbi:vacuolar protein sorting-associated protein 52 A-like isoform X2 [Malania oleifera]|uniref:vacuolar protein sorting-associated protein 52 A-like isoform X2 n=1 Tax=Malania oleifera TaxID=397392 RepID=UPI0025AE4990|nr:vacuolar protein sorting-associated protein 52 A-like isoform X2 [Malania oleifera]